MTNNIATIPKQLCEEEFRFLKLKKEEKSPTGDMNNWQKDNLKFYDEELNNHLVNGGNFGIIGGYGNLVLIDSDSPEITEICEELPQTFTIKTGSPEDYKKHYFFVTEKPMKPIRLSLKHVGDLGDIRSSGQYVVAPNCKHPKGGIYKIEKDKPIQKINSEFLKSVFKDYISPIESTDNNKIFEPDTKLRNSNYIRKCNVPDYCRKNKLRGDTSKNWKLFPYIVDLLHNRQTSLQIYKNILQKQGHKTGAIKGWIKKAREGKLMKGSCKKMRKYLEYYHPKKVEEICGDCPLYKKHKKIKNIKENKDYSELQKEVLKDIALRENAQATEKVVNEIKKKFSIYSTRDDLKSEMWIYKDGVYIPQGKSFVQEFVRKIIGKDFSTYLINNIIRKVEADTGINHDDFFNAQHPYEVPLENGILNIRTRELKPHTPDKIFFNKLPIEYDSSTECPNVMEHFKTVLKNKDDIPVLLELFGFLLLKEYKIEKAFMFIGFGRNGKSKTIELMKRFLAPENCASLPLKCLNEESFSLSELFGKMANLSADLSRSDLKETGMIKALIGRDYIQAKRKFLRDLNFVNYAKMIFASNELPKIYDTTDGFWTKWVLIEFPYKFVNQKVYEQLPEEKKKWCKIMNPDIISKITSKEELSGLLNLALDGLDRLLEYKDFSYSKNTEEVKDMWIRKSDSFTAFCYDHLKESPENEISKKKLKREYFKYRKKHKVSGCSDKAIKITLDNLFGVSERQDYVTKSRFWEGIKLKS